MKEKKYLQSLGGIVDETGLSPPLVLVASTVVLSLKYKLNQTEGLKFLLQLDETAKA